MKIFRSLIISTFAGLLSYGLYSCSNEEKENGFTGSVTGLETSADFLKLADNGNGIAGELSISANVPEVKLVWNTDSFCNLDTTKTSLTLNNGRATLPIKWDKALSGEEFGPEGVAYKAGVKIIAGDYSKYVPLIWAEKIDTAKVMESIHPASRAVNDALPRVAHINLQPTTVNMHYQTGGVMYVTLTDTPYAIFDFSSFTPEKHIDMSLVPNYIDQSQLIQFKWTSEGAPSQGFLAEFMATDVTGGIAQTGYVYYAASTSPQPQYWVNFSATAGGAVTPTTGSGNLNQIVSSTAYAATGYTFDGWYDGNTKVSNNATYTVTLSPATNGKNYQARFVPIAQNTLYFKILGKGSVSYGSNTIQGTGGAVTLPDGMIAFTPQANYSMNAQFARWHKDSPYGPQITATYGTEYVDSYGILHVDPSVHKNTTYVAIFRNTGVVVNRIFVDTRMNLNVNTFAGNNTTIPVGGLSSNLELHSETIGTSGAGGRDSYSIPVRRKCDNNTIFGHLHVTLVSDDDWNDPTMMKELMFWYRGYGPRCDFWVTDVKFSRNLSNPRNGYVEEWTWVNNIVFYITNNSGKLSSEQVRDGVHNVLRQYGINP